MSETQAPYYPMEREARCPFAPAAEIRQMPPVGKVEIWDGEHARGSSPGMPISGRLLNDPRLSIDEKKPGYPHMTKGRAAAAPHIPDLITNTDPPEHTRLRRTVNAPSWSSGWSSGGRGSSRSSTR